MKVLRIIKAKKGLFTLKDIFLWLFFYIPMTAVVIILLIKVPERAYIARLNTAGLENFILLERAFTKISYKDGNTGRVYPGRLFDKKEFDEKNIAFNPGDKGFRLALEGKELYFNKGFYDIARPLAPIRYSLITSERPVIILKDKKTSTLVIEEVSKR